jgi:glycosyltransferase involved in cell wall biosynthesis
VKVSIVVPAFNEEKLIAETLRHINASRVALAARGWDTELIVCDNNSTDQTAAIAQAAGATVVFEPVNQIARARNCGAAAAQGDWLIFVDADSHPSPELFGEVAEVIASGKCLAGGSTVAMDEHNLLTRVGMTLWNTISRCANWAAGSFIFCETAGFREAGGFNNELFASEEVDLFKRLKKLARAQAKKIVILTKYPLVTSGRKLHLYSRREHLRFLLKAALRPRKTVRQREACPTWYDGRR